MAKGIAKRPSRISKARSSKFISDWYPKRRCALPESPRCVTHNITVCSSDGRLNIASSRGTYEERPATPIGTTAHIAA
jgi:hypothetical protein